jgi:glycosyltransferase involved in cell wall biosynthesis
MQHEAARACRAAGVPYVFRMCGMLDPWCLEQSKWRKKIYLAWRLRDDLNGARVIHYTTEAERRLAEPVGLTAETIVEPNGIDLDEFERMPEPGWLREKYAQIGNRPIVLFLSRVHVKKGLDLLIAAFAKAETCDAVLVIAGHDDRGYLATAKQMVADHGLEDRVVFTGLLKGEERLAALADAELFALPSYQENFGVAVVEALAAGVPVVISDQVNIHDEITAAEVGAVVPTAVKPLAAALTEWMADPVRRLAAGERARSLVRRRFDWSEIANRWCEHYETLVADAVLTS